MSEMTDLPSLSVQNHPQTLTVRDQAKMEMSSTLQASKSIRECCPQTTPIAETSTTLSNPSSEPRWESNGPTDTELSEMEKDSVREVYKLLLQAMFANNNGPGPELLDNGNDINWDWHSRRLTRNAYGRLKYNFWERNLRLVDLPHDWIPRDNGGGTINIRKRCSFQGKFTDALASKIHEALFNHQIAMEIMRKLRLRISSRSKASVLVGKQVGMRSPCRCLPFETNHNTIQAFVLEIGMMEKSKILPEIARSYIERGTLCVMTVDIGRKRRDNISFAYSLYRRGGKIQRPATETARYKVLKSVSDIVPEQDPSSTLKLTVFDFFSSDVLREYGLISPEDPLAQFTIFHRTLERCLGQVWAGPDDLAVLGNSL